MEGFSGETTKNLTIWSISKVSTIHTGKSLNLSMCCSQKTAGWMSAPTAVLLLIFFWIFVYFDTWGRKILAFRCETCAVGLFFLLLKIPR